MGVYNMFTINQIKKHNFFGEPKFYDTNFIPSMKQLKENFKIKLNEYISKTNLV